MLARVERKTLRAIEKLSTESKDPQISRFFQFLQRTNQALQQQNEYLRNLDVEKVNEIISLSKSNPDLKPIVSLLESYRESAVTALAWPEPETKLAEKKVVDFLTTGDVAFLLGISPQQVRTYCQNGDIIAWRTNGNRGEWRIQVEQYVKHPRYEDLMNEKQNAEDHNKRILRTLERLSEEEYTNMIDYLERKRANQTGGNLSD